MPVLYSDPKSYSKGYLLAVFLIIASPGLLWWFTFDQVDNLRKEAGEVLKDRVGLPAGVMDVQPLNSNNLLAVMDASNKVARKLNSVIARVPWAMPIVTMPVSESTRANLKDKLIWMVTFSIPSGQVIASYRALLQDKGWQLAEASTQFLIARRDQEAVVISHVPGGAETTYIVIIEKLAREH
ncbi:MAG: hypothetical protein ACE5FQ_16175 [Thiogranum sp.]